VDFLPGGVMVAGVRNGIVSLCDSELNSEGVPMCIDAMASKSGCGCQSVGWTQLAWAWVLLPLLGVRRRAK